MAQILLIDDEPEVSAVLAGMLAAGGHSVVEAGVGCRVWDALRGAAFHLVVTDLNMPRLDGWAVARWVQAHRPGIPIIALSGQSGGDPRIAAPDLFAAWLMKPIRRAALLAEVAQVLRRHG